MLLFLFFVSHWVSTITQTCDTQILKTSSFNVSLIALLGSTNDRLTTQSIPTLNSNSFWLAHPTTDLTIQYNLLNAIGVNFTITGFAVQQRVDNVSNCINTIEQVSLYQIGYRAEGISRILTTSNSPLGIFSLEGLTDGDGKIIMVRIPPITTDYIQISKYSVLPEINSYCLRYELFGCPASEYIQNTNTILQYSYPDVTVLIQGFLYRDTNYTGICSYDTCTGGTGILTDGVIGQSKDDQTQFIGWSNPHSIKIRIDLEANYYINNISIYGLDFRSPPFAEIPDNVTVNNAETFTILQNESQIPNSDEINAIFQPSTIYRITIPFNMTTGSVEITFGINSGINLMLTEISINLQQMPSQTTTVQQPTIFSFSQTNSITTPSITSSPTSGIVPITSGIEIFYVSLIAGLIIVVFFVAVIVIFLCVKRFFLRKSKAKVILTSQNGIDTEMRETELQGGAIRETRNANYEAGLNAYESVNIESQSIGIALNASQNNEIAYADNLAMETSLPIADIPTTYNRPSNDYNKLEIGTNLKTNGTDTQYSEINPDLDTGYSHLQYPK